MADDVRKMCSVWTVAVAVVAVVLTIWSRWRYNDRIDSLVTIQNETLLRVVEQLTALEIEADALRTLNRRPAVAVGYGACYDLFADAVLLLDAGRFDGMPRHCDTVTSDEELLKSFAYYFSRGAAAERFVSNSSLFDELLEGARRQPSARRAIGGNAPIMATRFLTEGCEVLLGAGVTGDLKAELPQEIRSVAGDSVSRDDIHLILEYKAAAKWGSYEAPRANRYILHSDRSNPKIGSLEAFGAALLNFDPDLLVISGLQMMDAHPFPPGARVHRLTEVRTQMTSQKSTALVHFEMASYVEEELVRDLIDVIVPYVDSLGMNEQELANLNHILEFGNVSIVTDSNPRVAVTLDQMRRVFRVLRDKSHSVLDARLLSRIHVHTLAYQAILVVDTTSWKQTKAAAAKASLTAHRFICQTDQISETEAKLILDDSFSTSTITAKAQRISFDPIHPVSCWKESLKLHKENIHYEICIAPVIVCTDARQTAGAGDNISAASLASQI